jgi:MFS family permease
MTGNHGPRRAAVLAMGFIAASMLALSWITVSTSIIFLLVVFFLLGIGNGFVNPPITTAAISSMPKDRAAVAGAVATMGRQIGNNLGVALLGSIVFSIASGINGSNGKAVSALLASKVGAAQFVHALRYGYAVATALALAAIGVATWAFRPHPLTHALVDGEYVDIDALEEEETTT